MKFDRIAMGLALFLAASPVLAGPATQQEAARLQAGMEHFLGGMQGVMTVTPAGDVYKLHIDASPLVAKAQAGTTASFAPLDMTMTDQGGGKWGLDMAAQPFDLTFSVSGKLGMTMHLDAISGSGVFDENLGVTTKWTGAASGMTLNETMIGPNGEETKVAYTLDKITSNSTVIPAAEGFDVKIGQTFTGLDETIASQPPADTPGKMPMALHVTARDGAFDASALGMRAPEIMALYGWVLDHQTKEAATADQAGLKSAIKAALPFFNTLGGTGKINAVSVETPFGTVGIDTLGVDIAANGVVDKGLVREGFHISGLHLPAGIVPPWAEKVVPTELALDVTMTDFDLAKPAALILGALDLAAKPPVPDALKPEVMKALLPEGTLTFTTEGTKVAGDGYGLTLSGSVKIVPGPVMQPPTVKATLTSEGFETLVAAAQGAPADLQSILTPSLAMAKGLGRDDNGHLVWDIVATPEGTLTVNGSDMSAFLGK